MKTLILGDFSPTAVTNPLFDAGNIQALFSDTVELFKNNDVNFVNLEVAVTDCDTAIKKIGPPLKCCDGAIDSLKKIGVNYVGLANNHIFDYGVKGTLDTIEKLESAGIEYTGFGKNYTDSRKNLVIEKDGEKLGIIDVCEHEYSYALDDRMGARPYDEYETMEDIRKAKAECDRVVVIYHGGKEMCPYPSPRLLKACRAMAQNGADAVLCQHSHCIGCYENYEGTHILYGQGNFHFVKDNGYDVNNIWNTSLAVKYDTKTNAIEFIPIKATQTGIEIAKDGDEKIILDGFYKRNEALKNGEWKNGWHDFCISVEERYIKAIALAYKEGCEEKDMQRFAHFLDCEAHTDVWRELYKTYNHTNEK